MHYRIFNPRCRVIAYWQPSPVRTSPVNNSNTKQMFDMNSKETIQKSLLIVSIACLVLSYIFTGNQFFFKIGFYFCIDMITLVTFIKLYQFLSFLLKIIWILFILGIFAVVLSLIYFPTYDIKDVATFSILLFAISYNKIYKKNRVEIEKL